MNILAKCFLYHLEYFTLTLLSNVKKLFRLICIERWIILALLVFRALELRVGKKPKVLKCAAGFQLAGNVCGLAKVANFTTNIYTKRQCLNNHKCVHKVLNCHFG